MLNLVTQSKLRHIMPLLFAAVCAVALTPTVSHGQDTALFVWIGDAAGYPGQEIRIPVVINNITDSIDAYQVQYVLDRPNMIYFSDTVAVESMIVCANPPSCTVMDTVIDTVVQTPVDSHNSLSSQWEYIAGRNLGIPTMVRVTAIADLTGDNKPRGIPPGTSAVLIYLVARVYCNPDPFGSGMVQLIPTITNNDFSTPAGQLITPLSTRPGWVHVLDPVPGDLDYSGTVDVMDVLKIIECAFSDGCPTCSSIKTDFDCDNVTDVMDINYLIEYAFNGGPPPGC